MTRYRPHDPSIADLDAGLHRAYLRILRSDRKPHPALVGALGVARASEFGSISAHSLLFDFEGLTIFDAVDCLDIACVQGFLVRDHEATRLERSSRRGTGHEAIRLRITEDVVYRLETNELTRLVREVEWDEWLVAHGVVPSR